MTTKTETHTPTPWFQNGLTRGRFEAVAYWNERDNQSGWAVVPVWKHEVDGKAYFYTTLN